jgi:FKBP-type peptidyl-prolyl cis-trans isomerase
MRSALCLTTCFLLAACLPAPEHCDARPSNPATETFAPSLSVDLTTMQKTQLGDYIKDLVVGSGQNLSTLANVQIHYQAWLVDGTQIDDFSATTVTLSLQTQATLGLADGMLGMNVGGQRLIVSPSNLALGACQNGTVPPNSTIIYKVELLAIGTP